MPPTITDNESWQLVLRPELKQYLWQHRLDIDDIGGYKTHQARQVERRGGSLAAVAVQLLCEVLIPVALGARGDFDKEHTGVIRDHGAQDDQRDAENDAVLLHGVGEGDRARA